MKTALWRKLQLHTEVINLKMNLCSHFNLNYIYLFVLQVDKFFQEKIQKKHECTRVHPVHQQQPEAA